MMFVLKCSCLKLMFPPIWSSYVELEHLNQVEVVYISAFNRYTVKIVITQTKIGLAGSKLLLRNHAGLTKFV